MLSNSKARFLSLFLPPSLCLPLSLFLTLSLSLSLFLSPSLSLFLPQYLTQFVSHAILQALVNLTTEVYSYICHSADFLLSSEQNNFRGLASTHHTTTRNIRNHYLPEGRVSQWTSTRHCYQSSSSTYFGSAAFLHNDKIFSEIYSSISQKTLNYITWS